MDIKKLFFLILTVLLSIGLLACGKSGPPQPPGGVQQFQWTWIKAEIVNECLTVQGGLEGSMDALYEVVLELQPSSMENFCVGCPFLPVERENFSRRDVNFKIEQISDDSGQAQKATVGLTYCPDKKAQGYQWRLLGVNVNQLIPHALTPIQYLTSPLPLE